MTGIPPDLQARILNARSTSFSLPGEKSSPFRSIGELLEQQADRQESEPFLIFFDEEGHRREYSYRDFFEEACKTANFLASSGIRPGDRIATAGYNHVDTVVQYFGAFLSGAVVVPLNPAEDDERLAFILNNSGARLLFVREEFADRFEEIRSSVPPLEFVVKVGGRPDSSQRHFHTEIARQSAQFTPASPTGPDTDALIVYTSGTTGNPKGVVLQHSNLLIDAMAIAEWHGISSDQRMMCVLPIHHVNGTVVTLMTPLYAGASVVLNQRFRTEKFFERISAEKVSVVSVVPTLLQFLLHSNVQTDLYDLSRFRHIICGAGPLTVDLAHRFEQHFQVPIVHGYGLSETTCYSCFLPTDLNRAEHTAWLTKHGFPSIGVPLPVNEMSIHDPVGNDLGPGERGEIVIRGHNVMKCYFENPEANEAAFAHGWFRSGDEGFYLFDAEEQKYFFITGRIKELIIRGGVNISPLEIDEALMKIPGVRAGIAVGFENDWYGEEIGALIQLKDGAELASDQILAGCRRKLPFHKSPKVVVFTHEIPVTSTGKYQRNKCKELFSEWKTIQFRDPG